MTSNDITTVVQAMLAIMNALADQTRTRADNLIVSILKANEVRLAEAVSALIQEPDQPLSKERVANALATVGIHVNQ